VTVLTHAHTGDVQPDVHERLTIEAAGAQHGNVGEIDSCRCSVAGEPLRIESVVAWATFPVTDHSSYVRSCARSRGPCSIEAVPNVVRRRINVPANPRTSITRRIWPVYVQSLLERRPMPPTRSSRPTRTNDDGDPRHGSS
jgi:hypothetical protein